MNRTEFQSWTKKHIRLMDGATGSNLMKAGMPRGVCTEQWVLEHPDAILTLQSAYKAAGSDMVYAPTFCANRIALSGYGLQDDVSRMNRELVALSKKAVGSGVLVAGDMTTTGKPADPEDSEGYQLLLDAYREQAEALISAGADLIGVETMMGVNECVAAIEAIRSLGDIAVICTLSVQSDGKCYFDGSVFEAAELLEALGADAIGVNCSTGPDQLKASSAHSKTHVRFPSSQSRTRACRRSRIPARPSIPWRQASLRGTWSGLSKPARASLAAAAGQHRSL